MRATARSLWMRDRAVAELRWAAVTLSAMAILALVGKLLDPAEDAFDRALLLNTPLAFLGVGIAWSPRASTIMGHRAIRFALGPAIVIVALLACGTIDIVTLKMPAAAALAWLALTYAAVTPGYPVALVIMVGSTLGVWVGHELAMSGGTSGVGDVVRDEFVIRSAVVYLATTGMFVVVQIAAAAEARAGRLAARIRRRIDDLETLDHIVRQFDGS